MSDYIGWKPGPYPVHPETEVDVILHSGKRFSAKAKVIGWGLPADNPVSVAAYKVIKEYKKPSESNLSFPSEILRAGAKHMEDRAAIYDKEGERSIPATTAAFNSITGQNLSAEQGWLFMALLKAVRSQQGDFKQDNYEDGAAYFALMCEQAKQDRGS